MLKSGIYDFIICRGGTDMCFVLGFGRKRPDLKSTPYRALQAPTQPEPLEREAADEMERLPGRDGRRGRTTQRRRPGRGRCWRRRGCRPSRGRSGAKRMTLGRDEAQGGAGDAGIQPTRRPRPRAQRERPWVSSRRNATATTDATLGRGRTDGDE